MSRRRPGNHSREVVTSTGASTMTAVSLHGPSLRTGTFIGKSAPILQRRKLRPGWRGDPRSRIAEGRRGKEPSPSTDSEATGSWQGLSTPPARAVCCLQIRPLGALRLSGVRATSAPSKAPQHTQGFWAAGWTGTIIPNSSLSPASPEAFAGAEISSGEQFQQPERLFY